ncbi:MAG: hypothetical protein KGH65_01580 [Candidatus Micrarchaeota archaeon]|nr:hypothetical protein [Candidatus Micrarchaeota archaeon]
MGGRLSRVMAPLLLFLFLFGVSNAQNICTNTAPVGITINQIPLIGIALIALSISFDIIAIGYIVGKLVPGTQLSNWVKKEYWEVAKSAMLIAGIYSIMVLLGSVAVGLAGSSVNVPAGSSLGASLSALTTATQSYLQLAFCGTVQPNPSGGSVMLGGANYIGYLLGISLGLGAISNLQVGYYIPIPLGATILQAIPTFTLGTGFSIYKNPMLAGAPDAGGYESLINDAISMIILPVYTVIGMEYYLMPMLVFIGLAFMIPMGIIFRAMPFVRGIGGTLIGIGIGITIVFPSIILIVNQPISNIVNTYIAVPGTAGASATAPWWISSATSYLPQGQGAADALASISSIYPGLNGVFRFTMPAVVQFLLLILDLAIAFPIIDSIAKSLGGTINIEFGKLKIK